MPLSQQDAFEVNTKTGKYPTRGLNAAFAAGCFRRKRRRRRRRNAIDSLNAAFAAGCFRSKINTVSMIFCNMSQCRFRSRMLSKS